MRTKILYLIIFILLTSALFIGSIFNLVVGTGCGGGGAAAITVNGKITLPNGTEKAFSDTPLPINLKVSLTFSEVVDTTLAENLFTLQQAGSDVATRISWNSDNTTMTIRPKGYLLYQKTYTATLQAGVISQSASVGAFEQSFRTMIEDDTNGDGMADLFIPAHQWAGGNDTGRAYLFYGSSLAGKRMNIGAGSADALISGENEGDLFWAWTTYDINDDGYADLQSISRYYSNQKGRTYIFLGGSGDAPISGTKSATEADLIYEGGVDDDYLTFSDVGDVNDDGYSDILLISYECASGTGCVHIFLGPNFQSGSSESADIIISGTAESTLGSVEADDTNGDGIDDLIISATLTDGRGIIYIFLGGSALQNKAVGTADATITGETSGDLFSVSLIDDVTGDGIKDIIAGAAYYDNSKGRVYIFYGSATLSNKEAQNADIILTGEAANDQFGAPMIIEDITGDGINDISINSMNYNSYTGRIYCFTDVSSIETKGASEADIIITGQNTGNFLMLGGIGDVNGDGINDIVADAIYPGGAPAKGRLYTFFGGSSLSSRNAGEADIMITDEGENVRLSYRNLLDVNGDSVMDIFSGSFLYESQSGRGYLFFGGDGLESISTDQADIIINGENADDGFTT